MISLSLSTFARLGSSLSVYSKITTGGFVSVRSDVNVYRTISALDVMALGGSSLRIAYYARLGSSLSVASGLASGRTLFLSGGLKIGSSPSVAAATSIGNSLSLALFARPGSGMSIINQAFTGSLISTAHADVVDGRLSVNQMTNLCWQLSVTWELHIASKESLINLTRINGSKMGALFSIYYLILIMVWNFVKVFFLVF
jgi:hypothetical protein